MAEFADLEIGLHLRDTGMYSVDFRFNLPNSEADVRFDQYQQTQIDFPISELKPFILDPDAYGLKLTEIFFHNPSIKSAFAQARVSAQSLEVPLRFRLLIEPSASELHSVHWETLRDPHDGSPLSTSENLLFSRYLSSMDWRPVRLRAKGELQALVMVANPSNLTDYSLEPIDVEAELQRAVQGLGKITVTMLPKPDGSQRSTLNQLFSHLREYSYDILYLVCHGVMGRDETWLWLENDEGRAKRISGNEIVTRLRELMDRPRLVVLASCESAGSGTGEAFAALGPRLAESGIPAVLAMQDKISVKTVTKFMPIFFLELQRDGHIDRAVAVARGTVRDRPDHWMPVLFMRLKSGRIWYIPGFGDERGEFEKWQSLAGFIREKTCTPILGPGLYEPMLGSRREIAIRWAEKHGFPLAPQDKDVLPRVAQYVITRQSPAYLSVAIRDALQDEILNRYMDDLPEELRFENPWSQFDLVKALNLVMKKSLQSNLDDPYQLLAQMRLPIYITATTLDLMSVALMESGVEPSVRICPWNKWIPKEKVIYKGEPTPEKPLVYHLFGHIDVPNSLVFAEDRFFDYLIGVTLNKKLIPSAVRASLNSSSLLFLGFQMEDWEFRVFFRFLMAQEGRELLKFYSHAAVQVEPEEDRIVDIKRARKYLEEYFQGENIATYWGSSQEFLLTLCQHL